MHQPGVIPDPRSQTDRRQRDGLGLLPRATSHSERLHRQHLNRLIGTFLTLLGLTIIFLTISRSSQLTALVWIATMILGTLIAGKGIRMIIWRDRRRAARRGTGNTKPSSVWPASDAAVKHRPWSWIGRVSTGKASKHSRPEVTPPELE